VSECLLIGFELVIAFNGHLQMIIIITYNVLTNSWIRLLTTAHTTSSQFVFISRFIATDPSNVFCLRPYQLANIPLLTYILAAISYQTPTLLIHWTQVTAGPDLSRLKPFSTDCIENTAPHYCSSIVAVRTCLFAKPLLSNGCHIFTYSAIVA
jgi:hypothetical protein